MKIEFLNVMRIRGLIPVDNSGGGNCVFISLAELVFGNASRFEFMRYMIVHRLRRYPEKYFRNISESHDYCNNMATYRRPASQKELQAAADIFFAVIECYSIDDPFEPSNIIWPLRCSTVSAKDANTLRLCTYGAAHCEALIDNQS